MSKKIQRFCRMLLLPVLFAVLLFPKQAAAEGSTCTAEIPVELTVTGKSIPDGQDYRIVMEAVTKDAPMPEQTELSLDKAGEKSFGPVTYSVPGDYVYKVYQKAGTASRFTYDGTVYTVTVRVVNAEQGGLKSEVWAVKNGSTDKTDTIRFENSYSAPSKSKHHSSGSDEPDPAPQEAVNLTAPKTGDNANVVLWAALIVFALAAIVFMGISRRRQKEE